MPYDLIIFDCDGVLVDSEPLAMRAMCAVLNEAGVPATEAMLLRCFGMKQADTLQRVAALTGHPIPDGVVPQLWPATRAVFEAALTAMPGVVDVLRRLGDAPRCVASSSHPDRIRASLRLTGLDRFFGDAVFSSTQVAHGKPAPDLFLLAAATMSAEPMRCVVVEDSVHGIAGARAAGMTAFGFHGGSHVGEDHAEALEAAGATAVASDWGTMAWYLLTSGESIGPETTPGSPTGR